MKPEQQTHAEQSLHFEQHSHWKRRPPIRSTLFLLTPLALLLALLALFIHAPAVVAEGEPALTVDISIEGNPTTVQAGSVVTQIIQLQYTGGTANVDARFRQELPAVLRPLTLPVISEAQPQTVNPLRVQRSGRTWGWQGKMKPNALLTVALPLRVTQCYGADQTLNLSVDAQRVPSGGENSDSVTVTVDCAEQSISDISVEHAVIDGGEGDATVAASSGATAVSGHRFYLPGAKQTLRITLRNDSNKPLTIGTAGGAKCCQCLTCTTAANVYAPDLATEETIRFQRFVLQPGASQILERPMRGSPPVDEPGNEGEYTYTGELIYCLVGDGDAKCPDPAANPQLASLHTINIPMRASDLGDAPDSTNHTAGVAGVMPAYPGVQANFPTVFDPATGLEQGPRHIYPQFLHLGHRVSMEAEADAGPDQDPLNNILPAADDADNDRGDDGTNPSLWPLQHCQNTQVPVQLYISPAAVNWFQQKGTSAYLNGWLDFTRDGDWADFTPCQAENGNAKQAVEHIIIDHPVNVVALGAGLHTINVPTGIVAWPTAQANRPAWVRLTLSEAKANKPLTTGEAAYGDGRGYTKAFRTGETEDYLLQPNGAAAAGPDVEIQLGGLVQEYQEPTAVVNAQAAATAVNFRARFRLQYANRGARTAQGALLEFQIPEKLQGVPLELLRAPGIEEGSIDVGNGSIRFTLPDLSVGSFGTIVLGWTGCLTCTLTTQVAAADVTAPAVEFAATATVTLAGDVNSANDQATARLASQAAAPTVGFYTGERMALRQQGTTCQDTVTLAGRGRPGATLLLTIQPLTAVTDNNHLQAAAGPLRLRTPLTATVVVGGNGFWNYNQGGFGDGSYRIHASYQASALQAASERGVTFDRGYLAPAALLSVDPSLLLDPMSFRLTDAAGRSYFPPSSNQLGNFEIQDLHLPAGGEYTASADVCPGQIVNEVQFKVGDVTVDATQADDECTPKGSDACGLWSAKVTVPGALQAAAQATAAGTGNPFTVYAASDQNENTFTGVTAIESPGVVQNRAGQPVAGAMVTLLNAVPTSAADSSGNSTADLFFLSWDGSAYGQSNPQTTAATGGYTFAAPDGTYRVVVAHADYQPYVTSSIEHTAGTLIADDLTLSPAIAAAADYVVEISAAGFSPALLTVAPGSVIEFVNVDFAEHITQGNAWMSGVLGVGSSFKVQLNDVGSYGYTDGLSPVNSGTIQVTEDSSTPERQIFLPVIVR